MSPRQAAWFALNFVLAVATIIGTIDTPGQLQRWSALLRLDSEHLRWLILVFGFGLVAALNAWKFWPRGERWQTSAKAVAREGGDLAAVAKIDDDLRAGRRTAKARQQGFIAYESVPIEYWQRAQLDYEDHLSPQPRCRTEAREVGARVARLDGLLISRRRRTQ